MEKSKDKKEETTLKEISTHRKKKKLLEQVDKKHRDEAEDFLNRFKDDTLTGV